MKYSNITVKYPCGFGSTSICYLLDDGRVFKEFTNPLPNSDIKKYGHLINIHNKSFKFPIEFVTDNSNRFCGYIMGYASGLTLRSVFKKTNLDKLSIASISFENDIKNISEEFIEFRDFHSDNIIYDDKLVAVDTDNYIKSYEDYELLIYKNITYYKEVLYNLFTENLIKFKYSNYIIDKSKEYMSLKSVSSGEMIYNVLELLKDKYEDSSINSITDIDESYKKRK